MTRRLLPLLVTAALAACSGLEGPPTTEPAATSTTAAGAPATVREVLDGDTLLVARDGAEESVRLLGINAPESDECFGTEARAALEGLLSAGPLRLDGESRDQYGRLLAYAYAGDDLLNLSLVEGGFALAMHEDHDRRDEFLDAGETAYAFGRGMWSPEACGGATGAAITLVDVVADPPGPDDENLNGEQVRLENAGAMAADLSGWGLRDESSVNRYVFPAGTRLLPGGRLTVSTGCGDDAPERLYWCADGPVWNNGGDTALLLDPAGNVVDRLAYTG